MWQTELVNGKWNLVYEGILQNGILPSPTRSFALGLYIGGLYGEKKKLGLARRITCQIGLNDTDSNNSNSIQVSVFWPQISTSIIVRNRKITFAKTISKKSRAKYTLSPTRIYVDHRLIDLPYTGRAIDIDVTYADNTTVIVRDESDIPFVFQKIC